MKIPKQYYEAGLVVSHLLNFNSFAEYAKDAVEESIRMNVQGDGDLNYNAHKSILEDNKHKRLVSKEIKRLETGITEEDLNSTHRKTNS